MWGDLNFKIEGSLPSDMRIPFESIFLAGIELQKGDNVSIKEHSDSESIGKIENIF